MSSCAGYHTPIEDEVAGEAISDLPSSDLGRNGLFLNTQVIYSLVFATKTRNKKENLNHSRLRHQCQQF